MFSNSRLKEAPLGAKQKGGQVPGLAFSV